MPTPKVDVRTLVKRMEYVGGLTRTYCGYCGSSNPSMGNQWVCSFCENVNYSSVVAPLLADRALISSLSEILSVLELGDAESAVNSHEGVMAKYKEPQVLYYHGLLNMIKSNAQADRVRYDRKGFMPENAMLWTDAGQSAARAKLFFSKAASMCEAAAKAEAGNPSTHYTLFLSLLKGHRLPAARAASTALQKESPYLYNYSRMMLAAETGKHKEALEYALKLTEKDSFSMNAFYYIALSLFKTGKAHDALQILKPMQRYSGASNITALIEDIEETLKPPE